MILRLWFFFVTWTPPPRCDICHKKNGFFFEGFPKCPKAEPVCNQETLLCQETPGSILLKKIVISTKECTGCNGDNDGVHLHLTGSEHMWNPAQCYVADKGLHHPNEADFYTNSTTIFETNNTRWYAYSRDASFGWGGCWKVMNFL